jgi:NADPH:quinone reductase-like Zn-dependent oxidoreductase
MKYCSVVATRRGGPEVLQVVENDLRPPTTQEARVRVLAAAVSLPDVEARYGRSPFPPKVPFTPGYAIVGEVDAVGAGVTQAKVGDRVAALTVYGGYAEYVYVRAKKLIPVPATLDPLLVAPLILNYIVAYQALHRAAKVKTGDAVLIVGASGGIGTAFLQLGRVAGLRMVGLASQSKHGVLVEYGATPIDYRTQDFVQVVRRLEPGGLDAVFDGMGSDYLRRGFSLLRRGGKWVAYGNPGSFGALVSLLGRTVLLNLAPNGKSVKLYGTGASYLNRRPFLEDWAILFDMLGKGEIKPIIAARFPILEAARANALLESGQVIGNVVLVAEQLADHGEAQ